MRLEVRDLVERGSYFEWGRPPGPAASFSRSPRATVGTRTTVHTVSTVSSWSNTATGSVIVRLSQICLVVWELGADIIVEKNHDNLLPFQQRVSKNNKKMCVDFTYHILIISMKTKRCNHFKAKTQREFNIKYVILHLFMKGTHVYSFAPHVVKCYRLYVDYK